MNLPILPRFEQDLCVCAAGGFDHLVTELSQNANGKVPNADVVLQHQDRLGARWKKFTPRFPVGGGWRGRDLGQINMNFRASAELAFDANPSSALANNAVTRGETQPAVAVSGLCREKRFEQMRF